MHRDHLMGADDDQVPRLEAASGGIEVCEPGRDSGEAGGLPGGHPRFGVVDGGGQDVRHLDRRSGGGVAADAGEHPLFRLVDGCVYVGRGRAGDAGEVGSGREDLPETPLVVDDRRV